MMTREYPPEVYGGAGVHVTELVAQLKHLCEVDVHCMGAPRPGDRRIVAQPDPALSGANAALTTLSADLVMVNAAAGATVVHSHTWYAGLAGHLAAMLYGIPHVLTAHSLEPMRPWKAEQLGGGYRVSSWVERTAVEAADAVIAVSSGMRDDVLATYPALDPDRVHVVRNGIDTDVVVPRRRRGIGARRTRRRPDAAHRGVRRPHHAAEGRRPPGRRRAPLRARRAAGAVRGRAGHPGDRRRGGRRRGGAAARARSGVFWVQEMLPTDQIREILSAATVFVCPSVYEPLGIVNLEAMACATAVVASDVGGIPEVVADGETGLLVHYDPADADGLRDRTGRRRQRAGRRSRPGGRVRPRRPSAVHRRVLLGAHRRADPRDLPEGLRVD